MKRLITFLLLATALNVQSQTASLKQTDTSSFCFTSYEMNYWIACSFKSNAYTIVIDSLQKIEARNKSALQAKDYEIGECKNLLNTKDTLNKYQSKQITKLESGLEKSQNKTTFWKRVSAGLGALSGFFIIKEAIKP